jgi:hypothetical protein
VRLAFENGRAYVPAHRMVARALLLLVLTLLAPSLALAACDRTTATEPLPGVRLGMAPRDVRDRFEGGADGAWQTKVAAGAGASDDTVVEWSANANAPATVRITHARFEFHLGMLVAVRAHSKEPLKTEQVDVTPKTVTVRTPEAGGTDLTMLARDCPTHHDEAEGLAAKAH